METCISVRNVPSGTHTYFGAAEYRAVTRRDGVTTWRHVRSFGPDFAGKKKAERWAAEYAGVHGLPFVANIRHGTPVDGGGAQ